MAKWQVFWGLPNQKHIHTVEHWKMVMENWKFGKMCGKIYLRFGFRMAVWSFQWTHGSGFGVFRAPYVCCYCIYFVIIGLNGWALLNRSKKTISLPCDVYNCVLIVERLFGRDDRTNEWVSWKHNNSMHIECSQRPNDDGFTGKLPIIHER